MSRLIVVSGCHVGFCSAIAFSGENCAGLDLDKDFFPSIDRLTERMGFAPLRSKELQSGDLELRVWSGFGLGGNTGRIMCKTGDTWSAFIYSESNSVLKKWDAESNSYKIVEPKVVNIKNTTDWSDLFEKLESAGFFDIRDDSEIKHSFGVGDGIGYVVEIAKPGYYRTYMVNNPQILQSDDGDKFLRILSILSEAFTQTPSVEPAGQQ